MATTKAHDLARLLADGVVGTSEIGDDQVTTAKIPDNAVTTAKIANSAVTADKINIASSDVPYDNTVSGLSANTVKEAIDALNAISGGGNAGAQATFSRQKFTATAGQTSFTITDGYDVGYILVFMNGVLLDQTDFTGSDGSTVSLSTGARAGDEIVVIKLDSFAIAELLRVTNISASAPDDALTLGSSGELGLGTTSPAGGATHLAVGGTTITTKKPTVGVSDTSAGGSLAIRGLQPTIFLDQTGGNHGTILTDSMHLQLKDGTLDNEGYRFARFGNGYVEFRSEGQCDVLINADTDNVTETHNPRLRFLQDGGTDHFILGVASANNDGVLGSKSNGSYINASSGGSTRTLAIGTNDIGAILINEDQIITTPYQPAFMAYRSASYSANSAGDFKVTINTATVNRGNHYDAPNSRFTAPVAGLYKFDTSISVYHNTASSLQTQDDSQYLTFRKNGAELGRNAGTRSSMLNSGYLTKSGVEMTTTFTAIISLSAGDYVEVEYGDVQSNVTISNATFNGYLLG